MEIGISNFTIVIITIAVIIVAVVLHELMHGLVAKYLGDDTAENEGRLTLNPIAHIDPIYTLALPVVLAVLGLPIFGAAKPVPVQGHKLKGQEFGMALVAIMGPLTNLALAFMGGLVLAVTQIDSNLWQAWWLYFVSINVGFFLFNMLPIPPLDGSRVLYAFAPEPLQKIMEQLENFGIFIVFGLVLLGVGSFIGGAYSAIVNFILGLSF
ncbi:MAG: site-2 protease family protein [Patescibacteria group bacterium]|jgi:Zn-dependent protease|nr:site-2 protease family protein [Patescibacteria group bacterium]